MPRAQDLKEYFTYKQTQLICDPNGGWMNASFTENSPWVYASATTITVPTDATTYYQVGDKVRLKQGAGYKYYYIVAVAATLLTVTGGSDYTVANAAITDYDISRGNSPLGFPTTFNWAPTLVGFSADPTNTSYRFSITGNVCNVNVIQSTPGTSNSTELKISAPRTAAASLQTWGNLCWLSIDSGGYVSPAVATIDASASNIVVTKDLSGATQWTTSGGKAVSFQIWYEI